MRTSKQGRSLLAKSIRRTPRSQSAPVTIGLVLDLIHDVDVLEKRHEGLRVIVWNCFRRLQAIKDALEQETT